MYSHSHRGLLTLSGLARPEILIVFIGAAITALVVMFGSSQFVAQRAVGNAAATVVSAASAPADTSAPAALAVPARTDTMPSAVQAAPPPAAPARSLFIPTTDRAALEPRAPSASGSN